jgi:ParB-like chromosome segregation protein Spo0J
LINPVVVFPVSEDKYELVAGERRTRALVGLALGAALDDHTPKEYIERLATVGLAGLEEQERRVLDENDAVILARVEDAGDLGRLHRIAVVENIERASLSPLEEARALEGLADENGWTQRELGRRIGRSQSYIAQRLALLGLAEEVQEAMSTRALTATHARAIARVPVALQPAVTAWATANVSRDDTPTTTRQVQNRARQLAAFVDPDRWLPQEERVYTPRDRNRLALMQWAVARCDVEQRGEALLALAECGYSDTNVLAQKPVHLVSSGYLDNALRALGGGATWAAFAEEAGRSCETCIMHDVALAFDEDLRAYCPRWGGNERTVCERWIGPDDPLVIPITITLAEHLAEELAREFETDPFNYLSSVEEYVEVYALTAETMRAQREKRKRQKSRQHIIAIKRFYDWQQEQPTENLAHFQSHCCVECVNYRQDSDPPCRFVDGSLTNYSGPIAPDFGVLVTEAGLMLPRCEQFAYGGLELLPLLGSRAGVEFPPEVAVRWLRGIGVAGSGVASDHSVCWGILRWAPYGRPVKGATDWDRLCSWIRRNWDELGGAGGVALLLDVVLSERKLRSARNQPFTLLNAVTGEEEEFAAESFGTVMGSHCYGWTMYPDGWPRPWESG